MFYKILLIIILLNLQGCSYKQDIKQNENLEIKNMQYFTVNFEYCKKQITSKYNKNQKISIPYHYNKQYHDDKEIYIYIEGDGIINSPSSTFQLYLQDPARNKAYIGRFGQYNTSASFIYTHMKFKYSTILLNTTAKLILELCNQNSKIHLIGFSGGGVFAYYMHYALQNIIQNNQTSSISKKNQENQTITKKINQTIEYPCINHSNHTQTTSKPHQLISKKPKIQTIITIASPININQFLISQNIATNNNNIYNSIHKNTLRANIPTLHIYAQNDDIITTDLQDKYKKQIDDYSTTKSKLSKPKFITINYTDHYNILKHKDILTVIKNFQHNNQDIKLTKNL
ncbi:MAG: hypothetical protein AAFO15_01570 [Pseudomonadota bacterium]